MWLSYGYTDSETVSFSHWTDLAFRHRTAWVAFTPLFRYPDAMGPSHTAPHFIYSHFFLCKKLHMWGKAIIFKDKPSTANSRGISPLFYVNQSAGTWGIAAWSQRDLATARRHFEHNSFLRPACLFCVYIWKTVNIGRLKLFIALEWRRFWVDI